MIEQPPLSAETVQLTVAACRFGHCRHRGRGTRHPDVDATVIVMEGVVAVLALLVAETVKVLGTCRRRRAGEDAAGGIEAQTCGQRTSAGCRR